MDFELLIYLAFIAIYLVFQLLAQRKKQQQPTTEEPTDGYEGTLDDALQDIRDVLSGTPPSRSEAPVPTKTKQPATTTTSTPLEELTSSTTDPAPGTTTAEYIQDTDIPDVTLERLGASESGVPTSTIYRRLRDPEAAREAVLLSEILGPPRAQRPAPPFRPRT
ncbi:MAG: hypothetical protein GVY18_12420 [Bacteroidetes bacterium]|jgi:hypothetical protein|nr:hypothetical protein [Bacteroidota bacterium]